MKLSLKLKDQQQSRYNHHHKYDPHTPLLLRAKIPITIFNLPFLSHFSTTTTHPSDLSVSLSTNFPSFPSLKLSYATATASSAADTPPLSLTLKSGTGVFGSPNSSPLVISAHFSFNPSNPTHPNPTFSLFFKPKLGSFSLRKSTFSHPEPCVSREPPSGDAGCDSNSFGFVPLERPAAIKDLSLEKNDKNSILKGIQLAARTQMPLSKRVALNFRWWVNFAEDQMPVLRINKIGLHRIDDDVLKDNDKKRNEVNAGQVEALKGMCFWMKRELDVLTRFNREMKCELEEMKSWNSGRAGADGDLKEPVNNKKKKKAVPCVGSPTQCRSARNSIGEENGNGKIEGKNKGNLASDVESELQRAIKAAAAAAAASAASPFP